MLWREDVEEAKKWIAKLRRETSLLEELHPKASKLWRRRDSWSKPGFEHRFVAGDGSLATRVTSYRFFYLARAIALSNDRESRKSKFEVLPKSEGPPQQLKGVDDLEKHAKAMMSLLEVETINSLAEAEFPLLLFDGSLGTFLLPSSTIAPSIRRERNSLLYKLYHESSFTAFISKHSSLNLYQQHAEELEELRGYIPDNALFSTMPAGYSIPLRRTAGEIYGIGDLHGPWRSEVVTVFCARLTPSAPILRIEALGDLSDTELEKLLGAIYSISSNGYPSPLREAHLKVKLREDELEALLKTLKLDIEPTGREVLGYYGGSRIRI